MQELMRGGPSVHEITPPPTMVVSAEQQAHQLAPAPSHSGSGSSLGGNHLSQGLRNVSNKSNITDLESEGSDAGHADLESVMPFHWMAIGPIMSTEDFSDPLTAFGGIQDIAKRVPPELEKAALKIGELYTTLRDGGKNHSQATELLAKSNKSQPNGSTQQQLESFPAEYGASGRTVWGVGFLSDADHTVSINLTDAALQSGGVQSTVDAPLPSSGWAFSDFHLDEDTTILVRCDSYFMLNDMKAIWTPDSYNDGRAVSVFHLKPGKHRMFVRFQAETFTCDMHKDSMAARKNITGVKGQSGVASPLVLLSDAISSDVVEGQLVTPHLGIPVLNAGSEAIVLQSAQLVHSTPSLSVKLDVNTSKIPIAGGQTFILNLLVEQNAPLNCSEKRPYGTVFVTVQLQPANLRGEQLPSSARTVELVCWPTRVGGYRVAYPDFDNSIQHMWVAPPNISKLKNGRCLPTGCPIMLSLHGSDVEITANWGHNYAEPGSDAYGSPFPYPAWLLQPSNKYRWGTDWQVQGYDTSLSALDYLAKHMPGLSGDGERSNLKPDLDRLVLTGHSMGGHGCMVFSTHEPDRLLAVNCAAGWTSQRRYVRLNTSPLQDYKLNGLMQARMSEHDADYLAGNMKGVPFKMVYGQDDEDVPPTESRYMQQLVDSYSGDGHAVELDELPGTPHWFVQNNDQMSSFFHKYLPDLQDQMDYPLPPLPQSFEWTVASPSSFGTKGNLQLLQLADASKTARFFVRRCAHESENRDGSCGDGTSNSHLPSDANATADGLWYVETYNVRRFRFADHLVRGRPLPQAVVLDGTLFKKSDFGFSAGSKAHFCLAAAAGEGTKPQWAICQDGGWEALQRGGAGRTSDGPVANVLRRAPLCIVHGDAAGQKYTALYLANKLYFVSRYSVPLVDASFISKTDSLPSYCADANIIFIGNPASNTLLDKSRCAFPYVNFHDSDSGFTLGGMTYSGKDIGLMALGRLDNGHLALTIHGTSATGLSRIASRVPVSTFVDAADFMVLGPDAGWQGLGGAFASGFLDHMWMPSVTGSWVEPQHAVKRWEGKGYDESVDGHCTEKRQLLEESDSELQSFSRKSSYKSSQMQGSASQESSALRGAGVAWLSIVAVACITLGRSILL
jgi:hypothetical protein